MPEEQYITTITVTKETQFRQPIFHGGRYWNVTDTERVDGENLRRHLYGIPTNASRTDKFKQRQRRRAKW